MGPSPDNGVLLSGTVVAGCRALDCVNPEPFLTQVWLGVTDSDTPGWWYWAATLENPDVERDFNIWSPDSTKARAGANGEGLNCVATDMTIIVKYG